MIGQKSVPGDGDLYAPNKAVHYLQGSPKRLQELIDRL